MAGLARQVSRLLRCAVPLLASRDQRRKWVLVHGTGAITLSEIFTLIRTARADLEHQMWPMLVDARSATTTMTEQDVEDAVGVVRDAVRTRGLRGHVAVIADDDVLYARLLLYETRCAEIGAGIIRIFRQFPDGERWLDIVSAARNFR